MKYMLDTNTCIYLMKNSMPNVINKFKQQDIEDICISSITYSELMYGVEKSEQIEMNFTKLLLFLMDLNIISYGANASEEYGKIRADLETRECQIGPLDNMIAAHAKSLGLTLITNNTKEFDRVKDLKVENWIN